MSARIGVVVHFLSGQILKGTTQDFSPNRTVFHVLPSAGSEGIEVRFNDLKAVFFVKSLDGDPFRSDLKGFIEGPAETAHGRKVAVHFSDGELICGHSMTYSPQRPGFFVTPADHGGNNERVFVVVAAGIQVCLGPAAEQLAQKILNSKAA